MRITILKRVVSFFIWFSGRQFKEKLDVNQVDLFGRDLLQIAIDEDKKAVVEMLLTAKPTQFKTPLDLKHKDNDGITASEQCKKKKWDDIVKMIQDQKPDYMGLFF